MVRVVSETFSRPDEITRERSTNLAASFNRCRLLLARSEYDHAFVPIRSAQVLAVVDPDEIICVDNQVYAVRDGQGGRLIAVAWKISQRP